MLRLIITEKPSVAKNIADALNIKNRSDVGYITVENKSLLCTELGNKLVETFPIKELFDLEFTGRLEKTLSDIEKQKVTKDDFLNLIYEFTTNAVDRIKSEKKVIIKEIQQKEKQHEVLGKCPLCGHGVIEGIKGYGCSNWRNGCKYVIWKNDKFLMKMKKKPTKTMVKTLLKNGIVAVKGLTSKNGNKFNANMRYEKNQDNGYFSWKMEFNKE